ncbi:MAG TPA: retroviral-like aspartic protease [Chloroflexi bacterium]|nr:retroviral-like aspartic protease [Chloroflexota bacterium]
MSIQRFRYTPHPQLPVGLPLLPIQLFSDTENILVYALVDSGSALNILPFDVGLELGLVWEEQNFPLDMGGFLENVQAYGVVLHVKLTNFSWTKLAFAWVERPSPEVRVLLGQMNFFQEFDVHFYGHQNIFEISSPKAS